MLSIENLRKQEEINKDASENLQRTMHNFEESVKELNAAHLNERMRLQQEHARLEVSSLV